MRSLENNLPPDLLASEKLIYEPCGLRFTTMPEKESESAEYGACSFALNDLSIKFRVAKITPKKVGQFVTLWKRISGPIQPFDLSDPFDFYVVSARAGENFGQFVFPKDVLAQKGVLSKNGKGGKLAIRVYPPWDQAVNKQAKATQKWQLQYFLNVSSNSLFDSNLAKKFFFKEM